MNLEKSNQESEETKKRKINNVPSPTPRPPRPPPPLKRVHKFSDLIGDPSSINNVPRPRPPPLKRVNKFSDLIGDPSSLSNLGSISSHAAAMVKEQNPKSSTQQRQPIVTYIQEPKTIHLQPQDSKATEQKVTGRPPPPEEDNTPTESSSPANQDSSSGVKNVSSEGNITNPLSRQRQMDNSYQEQIMQIQSRNNRVQMQQEVQESEYLMPKQFDQHRQLYLQQQFVDHASGQYYIHAHGFDPSLRQYINTFALQLQLPATTGTMPFASYNYPVYPPQQQNHPHQYVYYVPARQAQAYHDMPMRQQIIYRESATTAPTSRPQTPPPPATMVNRAAAPAYNPASKPEMSAGVYNTSAAGASQSVQVHSSQHQPHYVGNSVVPHDDVQENSSSSLVNSYL